MEKERKVMPNSSAVLVLGILSIVFCWCYGVPGIIMGSIALVLGNQSDKLFRTDPNIDAWIGYGNLRAGKICAIIGLCLSVLFLAYVLMMIIIYGMNFHEIIQEYGSSGIL